jgi:FkbM family methyltransferase
MNLYHAASRLARPLRTALLDAVYRRSGLPWTVNGDVVRIDPRLRRLLPHVNEPLLYEFLRTGVHPGQSVLDIGAFLGTYAIAEARWVGSPGRVLAVEPTPWTFDRLVRHIAMNGLADRIDVRRAAVGSAPGQTRLSLFDGEPYRNEVAQPGSAGETVPVEVVTVDALCREWGRVPDWIRMDVQGFEFEVLEGACEVLASARGRLRIVVEVHPDEWAVRGIDAEAAVRRFAAVGLRATPLPGGPPLFEESAHVCMEFL